MTYTKINRAYFYRAQRLIATIPEPSASLDGALAGEYVAFKKARDGYDDYQKGYGNVIRARARADDAFRRAYQDALTDALAFYKSI